MDSWFIPSLTPSNFLFSSPFPVTLLTPDTAPLHWPMPILPHHLTADLTITDNSLHPSLRTSPTNQPKPFPLSSYSSPPQQVLTSASLSPVHIHSLNAGCQPLENPLDSSCPLSTILHHGLFLLITIHNSKKSAPLHKQAALLDLANSVSHLSASRFKHKHHTSNCPPLLEHGFPQSQSQSSMWNEGAIGSQKIVRVLQVGPQKGQSLHHL